MRFILQPFFSLLFLSIAAQSNATGTTLEHAEPPSWWVGMKHNTVQLMLHGEGLAHWRATVDYPGVRISGSKTTDNPNYLFVNLTIEPAAKPGKIPVLLSNGQHTIRHEFPLHSRRDGSSAREGFGPQDVIYLITPDRFANGDPGNDVDQALKEGLQRDHPYGRHGGDLAGIADHLDYLADMGFTQIWLNPILTNNQPEQSYHGYAQTDLYRVDPRFGSNESYRTLVEKANQQGIGVIQDIVLNHIGSEHWWMMDRPARDWINHDGRYSPTSHYRESLHDPHGVEADVKRFQDGWFVPTMPDLNQRNPLLANY